MSFYKIFFENLVLLNKGLRDNIKSKIETSFFKVFFCNRTSKKTISFYYTYGIHFTYFYDKIPYKKS